MAFLCYRGGAVCEWGTHSFLWLDGKLKKIDRCIAPFVFQLNQAGVHTKGTCCGHGKIPISILCTPDSRPALNALGLRYRDFWNGLLEICFITEENPTLFPAGDDTQP